MILKEVNSLNDQDFLNYFDKADPKEKKELKAPFICRFMHLKHNYMKRSNIIRQLKERCDLGEDVFWIRLDFKNNFGVRDRSMYFNSITNTLSRMLRMSRRYKIYCKLSGSKTTIDPNLGDVIKEDEEMLKSIREYIAKYYGQVLIDNQPQIFTGASENCLDKATIGDKLLQYIINYIDTCELDTIAIQYQTISEFLSDREECKEELYRYYKTAIKSKVEYYLCKFLRDQLQINFKMRDLNLIRKELSDVLEEICGSLTIHRDYFLDFFEVGSVKISQLVENIQLTQKEATKQCKQQQ